MSDLDLDALEATARAATPGPWHYDPEDGGIDRLEDDEGEIVAAGRVVGTFWPHGGPTRQLLLESQDAEHIATFDPPTTLALIARIREAEEEMARLRALSARWQEVINAPVFMQAVEAEAHAYHETACIYRQRLTEAVATIDAVEALLPKWAEARAYNAEAFTTGGIGMMREIDYAGDLRRILTRHQDKRENGGDR